MSSVSASNLVRSVNIVDGEIVNADVAAGAAIAYSKLNLALGIVNADVAAAAAISATKLNRYNSGNQTITAGGALTLAHGRGSKPFLIIVWLKCLTAEFGYSIGDELLYHTNVSNSTADNLSVSVVPDATNLNVRMGTATVISHLNKGTGVGAGLTPANWAYIFEAFA